MLAGALLYWRAARNAERRAGERSFRRADLAAAAIVASGAIVLALDVALA